MVDVRSSFLFPQKTQFKNKGLTPTDALLVEITLLVSREGETTDESVTELNNDSQSEKKPLQSFVEKCSKIKASELTIVTEEATLRAIAFACICKICNVIIVVKNCCMKISSFSHWGNNRCKQLCTTVMLSKQVGKHGRSWLRILVPIDNARNTGCSDN